MGLLDFLCRCVILAIIAHHFRGQFVGQPHQFMEFHFLIFGLGRFALSFREVNPHQTPVFYFFFFCFNFLSFGFAKFPTTRSGVSFLNAAGVILIDHS